MLISRCSLIVYYFQEISKLVEALKKQKEQEKILRGKLASQDEAIKKHEEVSRISNLYLDIY